MRHGHRNVRQQAALDHEVHGVDELFETVLGQMSVIALCLNRLGQLLGDAPKEVLEASLTVSIIEIDWHVVGLQ